MGIFSKSIRKFTSAESFQLYMEGLRSLQLYEEMASNSTPEHPASRKDLEARLNDGASNLSECVAKYPNDLLPQYYYAIVLSTQAQRAEAVQLKGYLADSDMPPWPSEPAEEFYRDSAAEFGKVITRSYGDVNRFAEYNLAQVLAKTSDPSGWNEAWILLWSLRSKSRGYGPLFPLDLLARLLRRLREPAETPGQAASAATESAERYAFDAQVEMLIGFIELRQAARGLNLRMASFPLPKFSAMESFNTLSNESEQRIKNFRDFQKAYARSRPTVESLIHNDASHGQATLRSFMRKLDEKDFPAQAKRDLTADYWNKWSRLALECAVFGDQTNEETARLINLAADYAQTAIKLKSIKNGTTWMPALYNSALARTLNGGNPEELVTAIVGQEATVQVTSVSKSANPDEIVKYILAMPLGTPARTIANLVQRAFGKLDKSTMQKLVRALDHAKLDMQLIEQITESLSNP